MQLAHRIEKLPPYLFVEISRKIACLSVRYDRRYAAWTGAGV